LGWIDARNPTRPKLTPDNGDLRAEKTLQRSQHRSIPAEDDGYVSVREVLLRLTDAVLLNLLVGKEQLDSGFARHLLEPLQCGANVLRLPVCDDGDAAHSLR